MKKQTLYILLAALLLIIVAVIILYKPKEEFDKRITFSYKEKRPYGAYVCYNTLPAFFKTNDIKVETKEPADWMSFDSVYTNKTLLFILTKRFNPSDYELQKLFDFVSKGNYVFISSLSFNETSRTFFDFENNIYYEDGFYNNEDTSLDKVILNKPYYTKDTHFLNPGFSAQLYFEKYDTLRFSVLGSNEKNYPNFIRAKVNNGAFYFNTNPFLFCNYFILNNNNQSYYQQALSAIPDSVKHIVWDDYYMYRRQAYKDNNEDNDTNSASPFRVLFEYQSFRWAFWLAIILLIVYAIIHIKRRQRFVNKVVPVKNDSLYFAQTIGRLYFEKGDHANLAKKMAAYFLEHVRSKYLINTSNLNNEFVEKLSAKSGYSNDETHQLVQAIVNIQHLDSITQNKLNEYYLLFQKFYKTTT